MGIEQQESKGTRHREGEGEGNTRGGGGFGGEDDRKELFSY